MKEISGDKVFNVVDNIIKMLREGDRAIELVGTGNDAFISNQKYVVEMKKKYPFVYHVFDPLHLLKNLRNSIHESEVAVGQIGFNKGTSTETPKKQKQK